METIVTAAQSASTSSNLQNYSIVAVQDPQAKETLAELTGNAHVQAAPLLLVFCPDLHRLELVTERRGYTFVDRTMEMFIQAVVDAALAGENAAVAAESMGLGICMIGGIRNHPKEVSQLLRLPPRTFALFGLTVGFPKKPARVKPRLPFDVILHRETYSDDSLDEGLKRYDEIMAATGIYEGRHVDADRNKEPSLYGWSEHSARRMARPNPNRVNIRETLESLGWEF